MIRGKVRDIYDEGHTLLLVSTDRLSAFDRAICEVPGKGIVLNQLSAWWFTETKNIIQNHCVDLPELHSMRVKKCRVLPIEVIVRGYITGTTNTSLWTLYQQGERQIFGYDLPGQLKKNQKLPAPILTPTTKEQDHDRPLSRADLSNIPNLTAKMWQQIEEVSLALFKFASDVVAQKGLILVDTKYEFGLDDKDQLYLIDELHTPDSSRYWEISDWSCAIRENREPMSFDKEMIRLWYREQCDPYQVDELPIPPLSLIEKVSDRYQALYYKITGGKVPCAESLE